ncbi:MAG TPA: hydrogenase nickel incorporation protein HypB [Phototrophicaceae bacterium]|nr:hydrogenase nickel incorporation protein HypB [Phototrophicaceae bacterium]
MTTKRITIVENILSANDQLADQNRARLDASGVFALNIMASPGAGKTSLIEQTIKQLTGTLRLGVIEGDLATSIDAERAEAAGAVSVQINTGGNCHLEAPMVRDALAQLPLDDIDLLIVENVGNLVCPAGWRLGTHLNVLVASVPEGADKPYKYPGMYNGVDVLVVNKIDLLPYVTFDMDFFRRGVEILNPGVTTFPLSCRTNEGLDAWVQWVKNAVADYRANRLS